MTLLKGDGNVPPAERAAIGRVVSLQPALSRDSCCHYSPLAPRMELGQTLGPAPSPDFGQLQGRDAHQCTADFTRVAAMDDLYDE